MYLRKTIIRLVALLLVCTLLTGGALALTAQDFSDVPADAWYYEDLDRLVRAGSINGVGEGRFAPDAPLTMAELLKLLGCLLWPGEAAEPGENRLRLTLTNNLRNLLGPHHLGEEPEYTKPGSFQKEPSFWNPEPVWDARYCLVDFGLYGETPSYPKDAIV